MKCLIGILVYMVTATGCSSDRFFWQCPFQLNEQDVDNILDGIHIAYVNALQLEGFCLNRAFAECTIMKPRKVYVLDRLNAEERYLARRHAACHFYDVDINGVTWEESRRHLDW